MRLSYEVLINFSTVFQILFFVATVGLISKFRRPGLVPLIGVALAFLVGKTNDLWQQTGLILQSPDWVLSGSLFTLFLGPFIYLYVLERTEGRRATLRPIQLAHGAWILPPAAFLALNWWPLETQEKISLLTSGGFDNLTTLVIMPVYFDGILILYLAISVAKLRSHGIRLQFWFSNIEDRNLSGIRYLLTMFAIMVIIHLLWTLGRYFLWGGIMSAWIVGVLVTYHLVLVNGLFLEFVTYRHSLEDRDEPAIEGLQEQSRPPTGISNDEQERLLVQLSDFMQNERPYLNPNLTVADLAKPLGVHARTLSQLINNSHNCNFLEYINRHRIEYAREELANHPTKSILDVAYDSGFNSKSTFNTAFKRFVQLTPTGFRRSLPSNFH
jgi:AraC-like DNA-binding protein